MANPANENLASTSQIATGKLWPATWTIALMRSDWGYMERNLDVYLPTRSTTVNSTSWAQKSWFYVRFPAFDFADGGFDLTWRLSVSLDAYYTASGSVVLLRLHQDTYSDSWNEVEPGVAYGEVTLWTEGTTLPGAAGWLRFDIDAKLGSPGSETLGTRRLWFSGRDSNCFFQVDQG